tara:strand:- start:765 stop:917 length:153 start_codon:yes stop_codon:yes gene_type:complete
VIVTLGLSGTTLNPFSYLSVYFPPNSDPAFYEARHKNSVKISVVKVDQSM